jgi:hypothetical protein
MSVTTRAAGNLSGLQFRVSLHDDLGRTLAGADEAYERRDDSVLRSRRVPRPEATVVSELVDSGGRVVDQLRSKSILVVQKNAAMATTLPICL